jgi:hypothetical protein
VKLHKRGNPRRANFVADALDITITLVYVVKSDQRSLGHFEKDEAQDA